MQFYVVFANAAPQTSFAAASKSASSKIIIGDFPPNSRLIFFKFVFAELSNMALPVSVDPVKLTFPI
jgi:hypothetical protein